MQFKVPQNVQREDTILWFISLRQLLYLMIGGGISYFLFVKLKKNFELNTVENILIWLPAAISAGFAFLKIRGMTLFKFILVFIEQLFFRAPQRHWNPGGKIFVSMTTPFSLEKKNKKKENLDKNFSREKVKKLAAILDGERKKIEKDLQK